MRWRRRCALNATAIRSRRRAVAVAECGERRRARVGRRLHGFAGTTFNSLRTRNFRLYFAGQGVSLAGTWMQRVAQSWLVLQLTHSGTALGLVTATQFVPVLALGAYGGVIADRVDKRRMLVVTQAAQAILALALGILTVSGLVELWMVVAMATALGVTNVFDTPGRQSFVLEMVGPDDLRNAVTLNSVLVNAARAVGPAVAGVLIATVGTGVCFLVNAASFIAVIASLVAMDACRFHRAPPVARARGQVRAGLAYVARTPALRTPLLMMTAIGALAYEFQIVLPLLASHTFHAGADAYGAMTAAMGAGAVAGGLVVARRSGARPGELIAAAVGFGVVILAAAGAPSLPVELAALVAVGAGSVAFLALANATLQLRSAPEMRGRVMALWAMAFMGTTPIGGPIAGWIAQTVGARAGLALGGLTAILAGVGGAWSLVRHRAAAARQAAAAARQTEDTRLAIALAPPDAIGAEAAAATGELVASGEPRAGDRPDLALRLRDGRRRRAVDRADGPSLPAAAPSGRAVDRADGPSLPATDASGRAVDRADGPSLPAAAERCRDGNGARPAGRRSHSSGERAAA